MKKDKTISMLLEQYNEGGQSRAFLLMPVVAKAMEVGLLDNLNQDITGPERFNQIELVVLALLETYAEDDRGVALKRKMLDKLAEAEKLAHEYFKDCELGSEREAAAKIYENIRTSAMVR
jgi:hypothetical protein